MKLNYTILLMGIFLLFSFLRSEVLEQTYTIAGDDLEVRMDIDFAKVRIIQSESATDLHVRIKYNREAASAKVVYDKSKEKIRIFVDQDDIFDSDDDDNDDHKRTVVIDLELPSHPQLNLMTKLKAGTIDFRAGVLKLKRFALKNWAGEVDLDFDQPNQIMMESMDVNCKIGEVYISNLGNAHCSEVNINSGIGELTVDFCGEYANETFADIDLDLGETTIILPEATPIKMRVSHSTFFSNVHYPYEFRKHGKYYYSKEYQQEQQALDLRISSGIGDLNFRMN
jgi:hypothetical protein